MPLDTVHELRLTDRWQDEARQVAQGIRFRALSHTLKHNGGYLSQACSSAEILATLYTGVMKLGPSQAPRVPPPFTSGPGPQNASHLTGALYNGPRAPDLDRFFFSPAHYALSLYAALIEVGRMAPEALDQYNQDGSTLEMIGAEHSPGMEATGGSLSQALSQAGGVALARKLRREIGRVWVFMSDGELQEGQTWEAFAALAFYQLDNLGVYVDINGQQCDGRMDTVMGVEPIQERLKAFGARVVEVDGHNPDALAAPAWIHAPGEGRPLVVLARTDPCRGIEALRARAPKLHYIRFKNEQERKEYEETLAHLNQASLRL